MNEIDDLDRYVCRPFCCKLQDAWPVFSTKMCGEKSESSNIPISFRAIFSDAREILLDHEDVLARN